MDDLKESIILNENAHDDDLEETFEQVVVDAERLQKKLIKFINDNSK